MRSLYPLNICPIFPQSDFQLFSLPSTLLAFPVKSQKPGTVKRVLVAGACASSSLIAALLFFRFPNYEFSSFPKRPNLWRYVFLSPVYDALLSDVLGTLSNFFLPLDGSKAVPI